MDKADYALLWANGASFGEVYDQMEADIRREYVTVLPAEIFEEVAYEDQGHGEA